MPKKDIKKLTEEIKNQFLTQMAEEEHTKDEELEKLRRNKQALLTRVIIFAVAGVLICSSLVYLGVAWYTRITSTHAVTFDVADYDLAVNDNTDNEFLVNIYDYSNVKEKTAAPGTAGYIPLRLSARHSDIDVDYVITFRNQMPEEIQKHIQFFYLVDEDGNPAICNLVHTEGELTSTVVDEDKHLFMESPETDSIPEGYSKKYFTAEDNEINGTLYMSMENPEKMIYLYWEWYLDAETAANLNRATKPEGKTLAEWYEEWNALDTDMGRYPEKYHDSLFIHLTCSGLQSVPELETRSSVSSTAP